jgi:hypothetical protein
MRRILAGLVVALALSGCTYTTYEGAPVPKGCCVHGDTLNQYMNDRLPGGTRGAYNRCLDDGGRPEVVGDDHILCHGIDF